MININIPYTCNESANNVSELVQNPLMLLQKKYTRLCELHFETLYPGYKAIMTSSCTKAIEIIALSLNLGVDDEVIMPSYTYVGVANAFANQNSKIVFADIHPDTMNICPKSIERAITSKTKVLVSMHYAGVGCDMKSIQRICKQYNLIHVEDNAQGIGCKYNKQLLGSFGDFSVISFDSMKNISCNEGGVLLYKEKYENKILTTYHNGTNRVAFEKGKVSFFEWVDKGSKYYLSEYNAAILYPLLDQSNHIIEERKKKWNKLYNLLSEFPITKALIPTISSEAEHNGHIFYIKCTDNKERHHLIQYLKSEKIEAHSHYSSLHTSKYAELNNYILVDDIYTSNEAEKLLRLPMHNHLTNENIEYISEKIIHFFGNR